MSATLIPGSRADQIRRMEETTGNANIFNVGDAERLISGLSGAALIAKGLARRHWEGLALAALGGALTYRAVTGHCHLYEALGISTAGKGRLGQHVHNGVKVQKTYTVNRSPEDCYRYWRNFENLPRFMEHLESVTVEESGRSRWVAKGPLGSHVKWEAEIINDIPNELIAWRSLEGSDIDHAGSVQFRRAPGGRGTEVRVELNYEPPAGQIGASIARLLGEEPHRQIKEDLRHFKQIMEAGEVPTVRGQSSCRGRD
jgi:uncharacterized membrane protein